jgi:hypothetical protein
MFLLPSQPPACQDDAERLHRLAVQLADCVPGTSAIRIRTVDHLGTTRLAPRDEGH